MNILGTNGTKSIALVAIVGLLASCGLPRSGPTKTEILAGAELEVDGSYVLSVDSRVNQITNTSSTLNFSAGFQDAGVLGFDTIRPGDTLGVTVWENVEDGLIASPGQNAAPVEELQVDASGFIFVPYAGRIRAAGNTPEGIRRIISDRLGDQTPDPQVQVNRLAGNGASVTVTGSVNGSGVFPIEQPTRTLGAMLARAGGISVQPEIARVTVRRGPHHGHVWYDDIYHRGGNDIALRNGDVISVQEDQRYFTAFGAIQSQNRVQFFTRSITALEALAQVGGLAADRADPTGIFVFRDEPQGTAQKLLGEPVVGDQKFVYVLDLTEPNGVFMARDFMIRDGDTVFVTEAPVVQFNKAVAVATGTLTAVDTISSTGSTN